MALWRGATESMAVSTRSEQVRLRRNHPPSLRYLSPLRFFADLRRDPLGFFTDAARLGDVVRLKAGFEEAWLLTHPAQIKQVLQDNAGNYRNCATLTQVFQLGGGDGLLSTEGEFSRRQRRLAQPSFHRDKVSDAASVMIAEIESMLDRWSASAEHAEPFDALREMTRLMLRISGRTFGNMDFGEAADQLADALIAAFHYFNYRLLHAFPMPARIPTPRNRRFAAVTRIVDGIVAPLVEARRRRDDGSGDLLGALLGAGNISGGTNLAGTQARDALVTFLGAGSETTSVALAWTWYLIATNPAAELRLHEELREKLGSRAPTVRDLPALDYTTRMVQESLRIYPPAWMMMRTAVDEDELGGFCIPRGTAVLMSPYVTQRRADLWSDPMRFDPDRFLPTRLESRPKFAYCPFGGGARRCIGEDFAMVVMTLVVATVAQRYRLRLPPSHRVEPEVLFTMRPRDGLMVTLEPR